MQKHPSRVRIPLSPPEKTKAAERRPSSFLAEREGREPERVRLERQDAGRTRAPRAARSAVPKGCRLWIAGTIVDRSPKNASTARSAERSPEGVPVMDGRHNRGQESREREHRAQRGAQPRRGAGHGWPAQSRAARNAGQPAARRPSSFQTMEHRRVGSAPHQRESRSSGVCSAGLTRDLCRARSALRRCLPGVRYRWPCTARPVERS